MTLPDQLRAIADRLEAAEADYTAAREAARGELVAAIHADTPVVPLTEAQQQVIDALRAARRGSLIGSDSAAVQVAAEEHQPGEEPVPISAPSPAAPIQQAGPPVAQAPAAARTVDSAPPGKPAFDPLTVKLPPATCSGCGREFPSQRHVGQHRRFCKGRVAVEAPADEPEPFKSPRATPGERLRARDASRAGRSYPRAGAATFPGE
jgi:hypothetical protein